MILFIAQAVQSSFSVKEWFMANLLEVLILFVGGLWLLAKYRQAALVTAKDMKVMKSDITEVKSDVAELKPLKGQVISLQRKIEERSKMIPDDIRNDIEFVDEKLESHKKNPLPHPSCPNHANALDSLAKEMRQGFETAHEIQIEMQKKIDVIDQRVFDLVRNGKARSATS